VIAKLKVLPPDTSPADLFWIVVDALLVLENQICRRYADAEALPDRTDLEEILLGDGTRALGGEVYHWIHPRSVMAKERENRYQEAFRRRLPRPPDPDPHPGIYLSRLGMYWHSDRQLPRLGWAEPGDRTIPLIHQSGRDATSRKGFRIALCPLRGDFHPLFEVWPEGHLFRAAEPGMVEPDALAAHLKKLVTAAADQDVQLLILPELSVDPVARGILRSLLAEFRSSLAPYGVIAGSFHVQEGGDDAPRINESVFLARAGDPLSAHRKRGRFRVPESFLKAAPKFFSRIHPQPAAEIFEDIQDGSELHIIETSLGRLAWLICADGIAADDKGYLQVVRRLRPDLLFVISMSAETEPFEKFFKEMNEHWIGTIFVNAHCICDFSKCPPLLAYGDLALFELEKTPPTRVRWKHKQKEPECIYYSSSGGGKLDWRPLNEAVGETGVSWLKLEDEVLGLVVDLGVHLKKR
jgi:predicted amidohydrolase